MRPLVLVGLLLLSACGDPTPVAVPPVPAVPSEPVIELSLDARGVVTIDAQTFDLEDDREVALEGVLRTLLRFLEQRPDARDGPTTLRLSAARAAVWGHVHWLRQVIEHPALAPYDLRFEAERLDR